MSAVTVYGIFLAAPGHLFSQVTPIIGPGSSYTDPFPVSGSATVNVPDALLAVGGTATTVNAGFWALNATGGVNAVFGTVEVEANTSIDAAANLLTFNTVNSGLGNIAAPATPVTWSARATLNTPTVSLAPNSNYHITFSAEGNTGLDLGILNNFTFQFLDGSNNPVASTSGPSLLTLGTLLPGGVGTINLDFTTGATVAPGAVSLLFAGSQTINADVLGGPLTNFATISGLSVNVTPVPEPGTFMMAGLAAGMVLFRRRRSHSKR